MTDIFHYSIVQAPPPPPKDKESRDGSVGKISGDTRSNEKKKDKSGATSHQQQQQQGGSGGVVLIPPSSSSPSMVPPQIPMAPPPQTVSQKSASLPPQSSLPQLLDQTDAQVSLRVLSLELAMVFILYFLSHLKNRYVDQKKILFFAFWCKSGKTRSFFFSILNR